MIVTPFNSGCSPFEAVFVATSSPDYKETVFGSGVSVYQHQPIPSEPMGIHTLTLTNVVVSSRILICDQAATTTHYNAEAASSTVVILTPVYGSELDNWVIKVRKGSAAPFYQPYETLLTAVVGSTSIYVSQIPD